MICGFSSILLSLRTPLGWFALPTLLCHLFAFDFRDRRLAFGVLPSMGYKIKKGMCRCGKKRSLEIPETNNSSNKITESRFIFASMLRRKKSVVAMLTLSRKLGYV